MYDILLLIAAVMSLYLIIRIVDGKLLREAARSLKVITIVLLYFSVNTLSGMLGYYIAGRILNRWYLLMAHFIFLVMECVILKKCKKVEKVQAEYVTGIQVKIWIFSFLVLFVVLLLSTGLSFMPVWGNVDEAFHFEMSANFRNVLDGMSNPFYAKLGGITQAMNRYSYIWGYHYNCAVISKIFHIDVLHVNHVVKCLSLTAFITSPMLWIQAEKKIAVFVQICYIGLMILFAGNWYIFFELGYTAQLFSLAVCHLILAIISQLEWKKNKMIDYVVIPVLVLFCTTTYMFTGILLISFMLLYYSIEKKMKSAIALLLYCLYIVPIPPIWNQLKYFLLREGAADEAITAGSVLGKAPSGLWIVMGLVVFGTIYTKFKKNKMENIKWLLFVAIEFAVFIGIYVLYDNVGYLMYKIMISLFPLLILSICVLICSGAAKFGWRSTIWAGNSIIMLAAIMTVLCKMEIAQFSTDSIKSICKARAQISEDEYKCLQEISKYDDYDGIEYVGMNGPSARTGYVFLRRIPYSWTKEDMGWSFEDNYEIKDIFEGTAERKLRGENPHSIYVLINEERTPDMEDLLVYNTFLEVNDEIFRSGNCSVRKFVFKNMDIERVKYDEMRTDSDYVEQEILFYGTVAIVNELEKDIEYRWEFEQKNNIFAINVKGRSIHGSEFILRLYDDEKLVYEEDLSGFEKNRLISIKKEINCDECEIAVRGNAFSDSIIIDSIDFYEK